MKFALVNLAIACCLFLGMLVCFETGRRIGINRLAQDPVVLEKSSGPAQAAVFGLLGLMLAFTFSGAASRFEDRRHLIAQEANAIGTAYLRIDLLSSDTQPEMRGLFRRYLDARLTAFRDMESIDAANAKVAAAAALQGEIWTMAVAASGRPEAPAKAALLLLPALNDMIDITTTRSVAMENHPPAVIFWLLAGLSLASAMLAGYVMCGTRVRNWFCTLLLAMTMSLTYYVILDLEYPRVGLIRIDAADQPLLELRAQMR